MVVGLGRDVKIVGRGKPHTHLCAHHHEDVAEKGEPDDLSGGAEPPDFGQHIAKHIGKGKGDGSGIEIEQAKETDDLDGHYVGNKIECDEKCTHRKQCGWMFSTHEACFGFERVFRDLVHKSDKN